MAFDLELIRGPDSVTVKLRGELDYAMIETCLPVLAEVKQITAAARYIADLSELSAIDSSGLGMLISLRNASVKAGGAFHIRGAHGQVAETLKLTRFEVLATLD
jgi:anti-anti-sigma factor